MKTNINMKELIKGLLVICSYFILTFILQIPFIFLYQLHIINEELLYILVYLSLAIVFILYYKKDLITEFKDFKTNYKSILKITFNYWLKGVFIMIVSTFIISFINIPTNTTNQENNINMLKTIPIAEIIIASLLAPIIEELIFRKSLKNFTKNIHLYAYTTGLIFGGIHLISSIKSLSDLVMLIHIIPYSAVGIAFGYAYKKTNNIYGTIILHSIHNTISLLEIIILGGLL